MNNPTLYKFLRQGFVSEYGKKTYQMGKWYQTTKPLAMCQWGFHASEWIVDAFRVVHGEILCQVEVRGRSIKDETKQCWSEMKIVQAWKWQKKDSVALAIFAAEMALPILEKSYPDDLGPRQAIEAAQRWLESPSAETTKAAEAAWAAARTATKAAEVAWSAWIAWAATEATWAAARTATKAAEAAWSARIAWAAAEAAWSAVWSATWAAGAAEATARATAEAAAWVKIEDWLKERLGALDKIESA